MNTLTPDPVGRRHFLKTATATALAGALAGAGEPIAAQAPAPSLIAEENRKPGAIDWQLTRVRLNKPTGVRASAIAATIFWVQGLSSPPGHMIPWSHWSRPHGPDARVQRITHNLLRRALS